MGREGELPVLEAVVVVKLGQRWERAAQPEEPELAKALVAL